MNKNHSDIFLYRSFCCTLWQSKLVKENVLKICIQNKNLAYEIECWIIWT